MVITERRSGFAWRRRHRLEERRTRSCISGKRRRPEGGWIPRGRDAVLQNWWEEEDDEVHLRRRGLAFGACYICYWILKDLEEAAFSMTDWLCMDMNVDQWEEHRNSRPPLLPLPQASTLPLTPPGAGKVLLLLWVGAAVVAGTTVYPSKQVVVYC